MSCRASHKHAGFYSYLPAILVAVLPKCPFCIMAYSGAMSLCSGKMLYPNAHASSAYLLLGIALIVVLGIRLNFRGTRTWIATAIASLGVLLLLISQLFYPSEELYYAAVAILFFGIWINGSFLYFYRRLTKRKIIQPLNSQL